MKPKLLLTAFCAALAASTALAAGSLGDYAAVPAPGLRADTAKLRAVAPARRHLKLVQAAGARAAAPALAGYPSAVDARTGLASFLWADASIRPAALGPVRTELRGDTAARDYLGHQAARLGLDKSSLAAASLRELHDVGRGPVIARYEQQLDGIPVFGQRLSVLMDRELRLVATSGHFASAAGRAAKSESAKSARAFSVGQEAAIRAAFADLAGGKPAAGSIAALSAKGAYGRYAVKLRAGDLIASAPARVRPYYYAKGSELLPAWYVELSANSVDGADQADAAYLISARDGSLLFRKNLSAKDTYSYRAYADTTAPYAPFDSAFGNGFDPFVGTPGDGSRARTPVSTALVTLQNGPISTNDPWLPAGATVTSGNNVDAYLDLAAPDGFTAASSDIRGAITSGNTFDYPYTPDADPSTASQRQFAIVNLFYLNNWLHDFYYDSGFNEAAGNAQNSNFGRGGAGNDRILAEGQDYSGRNNANMSTPPDGNSPRMQMFLFDGLINGEVTVSTPALGSLGFNVAAYGPTVYDVTGLLAQAVPADGCSALTNAAAVAGKVVLIDRGSCSFKTKTLMAQNAGALAVLLANNRAGAAPALGDDSTVTNTISIGTSSISQDDGTALKTALGSGPVTLRVRRSASIDIDGTLDEQIISHEFFHYVSNRLIGDALGLTGTQGGGMGEGWSDFSSLLTTVRAEDRGVSGNDLYQGAYPVAYYATADAYFGIRRAPYSTSLDVFPLTFRHIEDGVALPTTAPIAFGADGADNSEVHNTGEVWCNVLWEVYAALLNDSRYSFTQARKRMTDYVIAGLKMTPNQPTLLDARDALLAAARATDAQDFAIMANAFAKRGMGVGAIAPDRQSTINSGVVESYTALAGGFELADASIDFSYRNGPVGYIDNDGVLDPGETALLTLSIRSTGTAPITAPVAATLSSDGDTTFSGGGQVSFPASAGSPLNYGDTATASLTVRLNSATATAQLLTLSIAFPDASGVAEPATQTVSLYVNYDLSANQRDGDDMESIPASLSDWTRQDPTGAGGWSVADGSDPALAFSTGYLWFAPDAGTASDLRLITPAMSVVAPPPAAGLLPGAFTVAFDHYYQFESAGTDPGGTLYGYDGGVIEISTDNGATWTDVLDAGGSFTSGGGYTGVVLALNADGTTTLNADGTHAGFVGDNFAANGGDVEHVVLSFDSRYVGQTVRLRWRLVSDSAVGEFGWGVDNVTVSGVAAPPFSTVVAENGVADNIPPVADAGADATITAGQTATLDGRGSSDANGDTLVYAWTQASGPTTAITNAGSAQASVTPSAAGSYVFTLTVTDPSGASSSDTVTLTVNAKSGGKGGGAAGAGLLLPGLLALWLRRRRPH